MLKKQGPISFKHSREMVFKHLKRNSDHILQHLDKTEIFFAYSINARKNLMSAQNLGFEIAFLVNGLTGKRIYFIFVIRNDYWEAEMESPGKLRMTTQRQVIMEVLKGVTSHPTAGELCSMVRHRLPRISLGTVYRNLDILSRAGMLQKIDVAGHEMRFDGNTMNHYHLRCVECGRVFDVEMDLLAGMEKEVARESGFQVYGHRLEFVGRCEACQEAAKTRQ